jgi:pimeloyl-ACP methyl ester carboxylesterase
MRFWNIFCVFVVLAAASACSSEKSAIITQTSFDSRPTLIFIHGYYGSSLREVGAGRRIFLTAREILFGHNALSLFQEQLATPPGPKLEVEGLLGDVRVVPVLYDVDVYGDFIASARKVPNLQVVPFAYDWRNDLGIAVNQLDDLVKTLRAKGVTKIAIVAHSMGGLVASYYLGYGNQPLGEAKLNWAGASQVSRVVFLGTPFRGVFSIFRNMQRGADFAWNHYLLPAEAVASFPASYALIPVESEFLDQNKKSRPGNLFSFEFWEKHQLGLMHTFGLAENIAQARAEFTVEQLKMARQFLDKVNFVGAKTPAPAGLRVMNVMGRGRDTVGRAYFDGANGSLLFDTDDLEKAGLEKKALLTDGDGTVVTSSSILPPVFQKNANIVVSSKAHDRLFEDDSIKAELSHLFTD